MSYESQPGDLRGRALLEDPLRNRGTAFTLEQRRELGLLGLLPSQVEDLDTQAERAWDAYGYKCSDMERHVYLRALQDLNEVLFYRLLADHLVEVMPIIYTPVVGDACEHFSDIYRKPRGLFVSYPERDRIREILANLGDIEVKVIVVTDGERILGLGDQGAGGMGIPIGKLSLYTAAGGIHPGNTLPVMLDAGTDNDGLLEDSRYVGWRHGRIRGDEYDGFVEAFVDAVVERWPDVLLQFEDFAKPNANRLLERYRGRLCAFNDDIQGTAVVAAGTLLGACRGTGLPLSERNVVLVGAGSAGCGIAEQLIALMVEEGLSDMEARSRFHLLDSKGVLHDQREGLEDFQRRLAQPRDVLDGWTLESPGAHGLMDVVRNVRPSIMIGVAGRAGLFTEGVVREMAQQHERPIVFPLSNPTSRAEATPAQILEWSEGRALVATGSPFDPVHIGGRSVRIAQCNNTFVFPGLGLGVLAAGARRVSDGMLMAAARALGDASPLAVDPEGALLPELDAVLEVSDRVAKAVGLQALREGLARVHDPVQVVEEIGRLRWHPDYD